MIQYILGFITGFITGTMVGYFFGPQVFKLFTEVVIKFIGG